MSNNYTNSSGDSFHSVLPNFTAGYSIINALCITRLVLLIPASIFVLHLGNQQRRQHPSFKTASHSDILTYNLAVMELIWSLGAALHFGGVVSRFLNDITVALLLLSIIIFGETGFHVLTCVDRFLAVVHPVTHRELRSSRGVKIRNISICSVWTLSLLLSLMSSFVTSMFSTFLFFSFFITSFVVVCFCSFSVLCALFRPGPGAEGRNRGNMSQTKQRAFHTVMAITAVLSLFFVGLLASTAVLFSGVFCQSVSFVVHFSLMWLSLPSGLVLPLLYLQKTGKLPTNHK